MHRAILDAGWDILCFAGPFFAMLLMGFPRLGRLISAVKRERASASGPEFADDLDQQALLISDPEGPPLPRRRWS